jgi:hypothetical protein
MSQDVEDYFREVPTTCCFVDLNSTREEVIAPKDEDKPTFVRHYKVLTNAFV